MKKFKNILISLLFIFFAALFSVNAQEFKEFEMNSEICASIPHEVDLQNFCFKRVSIIAKYFRIVYNQKVIFQDIKSNLTEKMNDEFEGGILSTEKYYLSSSSGWKEYINTSKSLMNIYKTVMKFKARRKI